MSWKRPVFAVVSVVAFFAVVEVVLAVLGVPALASETDPFRGFSERVRVFRLDAERDFYRTAPHAAVHSFNDQRFRARKAGNGFRVFVLGGSSAYGFPWGGGAAFARILGDALRASWPDREVEVVNAAAMSYGSHRLRIVAHELMGYEPDLLVVYGGHNEFVERRFYREMIDRRRELDPVRHLLHRWRLYSALTRLVGSVRGAAGRDPSEAGTTGELLGLDVVREYSSDVGDAERDEVLAHFEENVRAILESARSAGVPVVLCTVPSNLAAWKPNQSLFTAAATAEDRGVALGLLEDGRAALEAGDAGSAVEALDRARSLASEYAEVDFLLGRAYGALERWDEAREAFVRARDHDAQPARAVGALNDAIRRLASEHGAVLVDVERAFETACPQGLCGFDLFEDYVHPKPAGHRLIAFELWRAIQEGGLAGESRPADAEAFDAAVGAEAVDPDPQAPLAATEATTPSQLFNLGVVLEHQGLVDEAMEKYRECVRLQPTHDGAHLNLGRLLSRRGRFEEAAEEYRLALRTAEGGPLHVKSLLGLGEALRGLGRPDEASEVFLEATRIDPQHAFAWFLLGTARTQEGQFPEAEAALRRAADLDPVNADILANLGFALLFQNRFDEAEAAFRAGTESDPTHAASRNGLAAALTEQGEYDEAERLFRESLRTDPGDRRARAGLSILERRRASSR